LLFFLFVFSRVFSAEHASADHLHSYTAQSELSVDTDASVPELDWPGVEEVNLTHSYLSSTVEDISRRIDMFFGKERAYEESTGTYVQARSNIIINQDGGADYDLKFRVKLRLPQLKSKYRLLLENDKGQGLSDAFNRDSKGSDLTDEFESSDLSASLQYLFKQTDRLNISLRPGVKFSDPVDAFLRLRMAKTIDFTEQWSSRGTGEFGYFTEEGLRNDWKLEFERKTGYRNFFRTTSNASWREDSPGNWFLAQTLLFTHILNPRSSLAYEVGLTGETKSTLHNTSYFGNVRYRRNIHRGWLFMELRPRIVFAKENNYDEELSLVLTLEVLFGEKYAHE
jgi:hypothetical protein